MTRTYLVAVIAFVLSACTPGANLPLLQPEAAQGSYRLGPEDQVRVTVFDDTRFGGTYRVTDAGTLAVPMLGNLRARGLTTSELERTLSSELRRRNLITNPGVAVEMAAYRPVFVLGMVERGGQYPYQPGMTALSAVAVAGGFNYRAVQDYVSITRTGSDGVAREYRAARDAIIHPGDVITVFERRL
jgi:polysaccharide export outer membrane protein